LTPVTSVSLRERIDLALINAPDLVAVLAPHAGAVRCPSSASDPIRRADTSLQAKCEDGYGLWDRSRRSHLIRRIRPEISARCIAASLAGHIALVTQGGHVLRFEDNLEDLTADVAVPFIPNRLHFTDNGQLLSVLAEDGQIAIIDADSKVHQLVWPKGSTSPRAIVVAREAPIIAGQFSDDTIKVFGLIERSLCPVCTFELGGH